MQKSERESSIGNTLGQVKEIVWIDIIESINEIWSCIHIIFEQKELIEKANDAITKIKEELWDKPTTANNIIKFLNFKKKYELEELGVDDRTETILEVKQVLTKRNLIVQLEEKCHSLEIVVNNFFQQAWTFNSERSSFHFCNQWKNNTKKRLCKEVVGYFLRRN